MINKTFSKPTQVKISIIGETNSETNITDVAVIGAIAYNNFIIRGDNGKVIEISETITETPAETPTEISVDGSADGSTNEKIQEIYLIEEYNDWVDFNEEIRD